MIPYNAITSFFLGGEGGGGGGGCGGWAAGRY